MLALRIAKMDNAMADDFTLHPRLAADTVELARWPLCRVLLMNDARFPWLILVPARPGLREIHDLPALERSLLIEEIARASSLVQKAFTAHKTNVAALGNQVPQLHVHVIARLEGDAAWPKPVWSVGTAQPMPDAEREVRIAALRGGL
jgi:diadenosine tetraphosphate (Ap4A) HIT family hydrolase